MIYETKITFTGLDAKGNPKVVKQAYLIKEACCFADAEEQMNEAMQGWGYEEFDVVAIKRSKIKEIINSRTNAEERIFVADVAYTQYNDDGEEVEYIYKMALFAENFESAKNKLAEYLRQGYDMEIVGLKCSKLIDII